MNLHPTMMAAFRPFAPYLAHSEPHPTEEICAICSGSGEGQSEGTLCRNCAGTGIERVSE